MIINYIYHSCYEIITKDYQLVFDYYKGPLKLRDDKEKIFFVSHDHDDHYSKEIHSLADKVFLWDGMDYRDEKTIALAPGQSYQYKDILIKTSGSTDLGLSFEINIEGKRIIHVGDLNNWIWPEDSREDRKTMEKNFLGYLSAFEKNPQVLFFLVDYRMGKNYDLGVRQALDLLEPQLLFPIHFTDYPEILPIFKDQIKDRVEMILPVDNPYHLK